MKAAVITFPGSNRDGDVAKALKQAGAEVAHVWHGDTELPAGTDLVVLPGGFSYGDYLRTGAIAGRAHIMDATRDHAARGGYVLGICNGFQIACEAGLLPGILVRNAHLKFVCKRQHLKVERNDTPYTRAYAKGQAIDVCIAHGSLNYIAGIYSPGFNVLGLMPHPENLIDSLVGGTDGRGLFESLVGSKRAA